MTLTKNEVASFIIAPAFCDHRIANISSFSFANNTKNFSKKKKIIKIIIQGNFIAIAFASRFSFSFPSNFHKHSRAIKLNRNNDHRATPVAGRTISKIIP